MKIQTVCFVVALMILGATPAFAVKANHSSDAAVAASLVQAIQTNDFECFYDAISPQSRTVIESQTDPKKFFEDFSKSVRQVLQRVPEDQRPLVSMLIVGQFQRLACKIGDQWYFDANALTGMMK